MKVVVVGGAGIIGQRLVPALLAAGHEAAVLSRHPESAVAVVPAAADVVEWQPDGLRTAWTSVLFGASAVVDLAGAGEARRTARGAIGRLHAVAALVDGLAAVPPSERPGVVVSASHLSLTERERSSADRELRGWLRIEEAARDAAVLDMRVVLLRMAELRGGGGQPARVPLGPWIALDELVALIVRAVTGWELTGPVLAVEGRALHRRTVAERAPARADSWAERAT